MNSIELDEVAADIHAAVSCALSTVGTVKNTIHEAASASTIVLDLGRQLRSLKVLVMKEP